ncbi:Mcm16p [Kluyveromyces lactis]|uniref:KLLA0E05523p n=1 Tax=Kluyveromyces lactis (strain ATCC 8585 / CBS 2359 / DSM 70799 / NBRC 1267 / NRRL Y-1140 / WM37) TaxID=284590 RepID=Q6CPE4_KLULA|nr:uncharacterized protein KLLA0_E05523g [Kluyveromyces lactis]CAG99282.1 KLLA0E05523p [Kluyveromyces lactis]|eukprot:XP_454195.1 uncharacterized protein KLLA0_E05523g [Kluyveromyces lactis]
MQSEVDDLERRYVSVYKELLLQLDKLFLLQNGSNMDSELKAKSRLRALHQLNVSETASYLNMKDTNNDTKRQVTTLLENKYERDGELRVNIEKHWTLIEKWLSQTHETIKLRQKLVELSAKFPEPAENSPPDPKLTQTLEMLRSIYSVLVIQGGYQDVVFDHD